MAQSGEKSLSEAQSLIEKHALLPHPEGGWYRRTFLSKDRVIAQAEASCRYSGETRAAGTSILYLLKDDEFSAWHSVQSDETWYFHAGDPLSLWVIHKESACLEEVCLGPDLLQYTVIAGSFFAAKSQGPYSLVGCAVTPGFDFKDFHLMSEVDFERLYPQYQTLACWIRPSLRNRP